MTFGNLQSQGAERRQSYQIHHLSFMMISNCHDLFAFFDELFGNFRSDRIVDHPAMSIEFRLLPAAQTFSFAVSPCQVVDIDLNSVDCMARPVPYPVLYRAGQQCLFLKDIVRGYGSGYVITPCSIWQLNQILWNILLPTLFNMLWVRELFSLHAASVASGQKGVVVMGASGKGKTTLLLHLLQAGLQYMADDIVFLRATSAVPELLCFPFRIRALPESLKFFPALHPLIAAEKLDGTGKYPIGWEQMSSMPIATSATPALLLFPEITTERESHLAPIPAIEAAIQCLPENVTASEMESGQKHFQLVSLLFQHVPCYRVWLGQDMSAIGPQVLELLA